MKISERLIKHAYYWLLLAESHLTRSLIWRHAAECLSQLFARYARPFGVLSVLGLMWWNWDHIGDLPGTHDAVCAYDNSSWTPKWPLPHADPQRCSIAIAHLEYDQSLNSKECCTRRSTTSTRPLISNRWSSIGRFAWRVTRKGERRGHEKAREYLAASRRTNAGLGQRRGR